MKNSWSLLFFLFISLACTRQKPSNTEIVTKYYKAKDALNFEAIKQYIGDSLTITEGDYVMPYDRDGFYEVFKWDSIFQPTYEVIEMEEHDNKVVALVSSTSIRFEFLKNNPLICKHNIFLNDGKIYRIENLDCSNADWKLWEKERDSLVKWISTNHPELDGFIYDMTMNGSLNYLKSIDLYTARK